MQNMYGIYVFQEKRYQNQRKMSISLGYHPLKQKRNKIAKLFPIKLLQNLT